MKPAFYSEGKNSVDVDGKGISAVDVMTVIKPPSDPRHEADIVDFLPENHEPDNQANQIRSDELNPVGVDAVNRNHIIVLVMDLVDSLVEQRMVVDSMDPITQGVFHEHLDEEEKDRFPNRRIRPLEGIFAHIQDVVEQQEEDVGDERVGEVDFNVFGESSSEDLRLRNPLPLFIVAPELFEEGNFAGVEDAEKQLLDDNKGCDHTRGDCCDFVVAAGFVEAYIKHEYEGALNCVNES